MKNFSDYGIHLPSGATGNVRTACPWCSRDRKKKNVKCLSVNVEKECWQCFHCGVSGGLGEGIERPKNPHWSKPQYRKPDPRPHLTLPQNAVDWFHSRGITDAVLHRNRIDYGLAYMPQLEEDAEAVVFPYYRNEELINRKYRTLADKHFRMDPGCELILYGLDDIDLDSVIWVEGEMDRLSLEVAGYRSVVSVPNGAPPPDAKNYDSHFHFLEVDHEKINSIKRHILAVDSDPAGQRLEAELSRRIGIERCFRVQWPEGIKDANEMLVKHGADELKYFVDDARPFPIRGVVEIGDKIEDIEHLYDYGIPHGVSTGWPSLDNYYTVRPGEFTAVSGIPGSGKSNWIDSLIINIASKSSWRFAVFSPENLPVEQHMASLAEKVMPKPFYHGRFARMDRPELHSVLGWMAKHIFWIMPEDETDWELENILKIAGQLVLRYGIRGLVIDPWNELEALRPVQMSETEYIGRSLKRIRVFARQRSVHVWVVIHPAKMYRNEDGEYPVPSLYDCAGSAHWRNKSDNGIIIWRDLKNNDSREVDIHIQKIRFRHVGRRGKATLYYDPVCAVYQENPISPEVVYAQTD